MKHCPQCGKLYPDDDLNFCLDDGTALRQTFNTSDEETVVLPSRRSPTPGPVVRKGVSPIFAYLAIGLIALIAGGGIVAWIMTRETTTPTSGNTASQTNANARQDNRVQNTAPESTPNTSNQSSPSPSPTSASIDVDTARREVNNALDGWLAALTEKDLDRRMAFYADRLDTYYTKRNVAASSVRGENAKVLDRYSVLDMDVSDVTVEVDKRTGEVTTTFDKTFNFRGGERDFSGAVRSEFRWRKIGGRWKIVSERDLKVY